MKEKSEKIDDLMKKGKREAAYKRVKKFFASVITKVEQQKIGKEKLFTNRNPIPERWKE